jgi:hypothetical protein
MTRAAPQPDFWQRLAARRSPPALERRTHIALADLLRVACRPGWWWSHIPSGEYRTEQAGALLKRMGTQRGMLDFLLISPTGEHHWLELKRGVRTTDRSAAGFHRAPDPSRCAVVRRAQLRRRCQATEGMGRAVRPRRPDAGNRRRTTMTIVRERNLAPTGPFRKGNGQLLLLLR